MPAPNFDFKTEVDFFSSYVLILDELGEVSTHLVDALLSRGCFVYYFGREKKESFNYLFGKSNFSHLDSFAEIPAGKKIDYVFCFPGPNFSQTEQFVWLRHRFQGKILFCLSLDFPEICEYVKIIQENQLPVRLVVFDNLFGPRIKSGILGKLFSLATSEGSFDISADPEEEIFPISSTELINQIMRLTFSPDTENKAFFLESSVIKVQDLGRCLQKFLPKTEFLFSGKSEGVSKKREKVEKLEKVKVQEDLEEKIEETAAWFMRNIPEEKRPEEKKEKEKLDFLFTQESKVPETPLKKKCFFRKILLGFFLFFSLLFVVFGLPLILSGVLGVAGIRQASFSEKQIEEGNFVESIRKSTESKKFFSLAQKTLQTSLPFYSLIGVSRPVEDLSECLEFSQYITNSLSLSLGAAQEAVRLSGLFVNGEEANLLEALGPIKVNLYSAYEQASLAQSFLNKVEPGFKLLRQTEKLEKLKKYLPEIREILAKGQDFLSVAPKILGIGGRKTYLVLFQNNMEIRPTGGFIGSFGIINLENGKLVSFEIFDVYQADGQLKGYVEPPGKLRQYLGEATWYLRDSNWDPDFPVSAKRALWFLDKEMQIAADGTIAVTLEVAKSLLAAVGGVEVPEYKEKIEAGNLFEKAEYYSELGTFPGSTQKKDFLGSLAKAVFEEIKRAEGRELVNVAKAVLSSLEQKEMILYFNDEESQRVVSRLNWGGNLRDYQPSSEQFSVLADYLFIVEANVGIDKANYFVKRKIDQQISLDNQGRVKEKLEITYENQSPSENWPAGRYKNYLRVYLPRGARVTSILTSDPVNPGLWLPLDTRFLDISEEHGKSVFGILVEVPIKSEKKIEISYDLPVSLDLSKKLGSYLLMIQKQPGVYPSPYSLTVNYPANFIPLRVIPSAVVNEGKLLITGKLDRDLIFQVDLAH